MSVFGVSFISTARRGALYLQPPINLSPSIPSERGPLSTPLVTVLDQRGPPLALRSLRFCTREGPPWHSVHYGFRPERAPLGTPFITVLEQRGPPLALLRYVFGPEALKDSLKAPEGP